MSFTVCFFVGPSRWQQNRLTLAADIPEKGQWERTKFSRLLEGGLMYTTTETGDPCSRGSPWGTKILKGVKNCNAFLQAGLTDLDEIWHDGRY